jgi:hypothetical protein
MHLRMGTQTGGMGPKPGAGRRVRRWLPGLACVALLALAPPALATFHEIFIREVYPGSAAEPDAQYVELQMWAGGQNHVKGHVLRSYDAAGTAIAVNTFGSDVPSGANQSTIVIATPEAETEFGLTADGPLSPSNQLDPAGGAVCWENLDCVSWGSFNGSSLPSPAGSPASPAGIPDGMALRRTIAPGCATLLEPTDDHDNSAVDFTAVLPAPRPNSVAPGERPCPAAGAQQGGAGGGSAGQSQGERGAPRTTLKRKPPQRTHDRTPTFGFGADETSSTFQCKVDSKPFKPCRSPFTSAKLSLGRHTFRVRARDDSGALDQSPATCSFRVTARRG